MADSRNLDLFKKEQCFSIATLACYITSLPKAIYEKKSNVLFFVLPLFGIHDAVFQFSCKDPLLSLLSLVLEVQVLPLQLCKGLNHP